MSRVRAVGSSGVHSDRAACGGCHDCLLVQIGVQLDHQVQAGGDAVDREMSQGG